MPPRRRTVRRAPALLRPPISVHNIPVELCSEIFLFMIHVDPRSQLNLMLVCRRWRAIMLSTPGVRLPLRIGRWTQVNRIEAVTQGSSSHLDVIVDVNNMTYRTYSNDRDFYASFMAAAQVASRWRSLELVSFPPPGSYEDLDITQPLSRLASFQLRPDCRLGNFLGPLMTVFAATATPRLTVLDVADPDASIYLVQPTCLHFFSSLTVLRLICRRMDSPLDILPCLHKLVTFEAHHLHIPIYPLETHLPLIQTLQFLHLRSVSIQWMAGHIFPSLQSCHIMFPHHVDTIALQPVIMPSCSDLTYNSNDLGPISHFSLPPLASLGVTSGQWSKWRGNLQLAILQPIIFTSAQSLTHLSLQVQCSETLLAYMLALIPALELLWLGLASPHALSIAFFKIFVSRHPSANARIRKKSETAAVLCSGLRKLHLHYKRWLRGSEKPAVIQAFGDIVTSRQSEEGPDFSLFLSFDEGPRGQVWKVHEPTKRHKSRNRVCVGFPSPQGVIALSAAPSDGDFIPPLLRESTYFEIETLHLDTLPIVSFLSFYNLVELRIDTTLFIKRGAQLRLNFPLFHTLKVLQVDRVQPWLILGHTFHKLERYHEFSSFVGPNLSQSLYTEMPLCTKLRLPLSSLATFKLPRVSELVVEIDRPNAIKVWERQVAVNSNLSGLKRLSIRDLGSLAEVDLIQILKPLQALETLVITLRRWDLSADFFRSLVPMGAQEASGLDRASRKDQRSVVLCPRLENVQISQFGLFWLPELIPVLRDIVTLRAVVESPLKSFTLFNLSMGSELIGRDGSFVTDGMDPAKKFTFDTWFDWYWPYRCNEDA